VSEDVEVWVPVAGIPLGLYEISSRGRVHAVSRKWVDAIGRPYTKKGRILTATINMNGYPMVHLRYYGRLHPRTVHSLVVEAFIAPRRGLDTRHLDGNRTNNRLSNLDIGSRTQNMADAKRHGTLHRAPGEKSSVAKLSNEQAREIRLSKRMAADLAVDHGVSVWAIHDIREGNTYRHAGGPIRKGRPMGTDNTAAKLTEDAVLDIRYSSARVCDLMRKYGVTKHTVQNARAGRTWKHVQLLTSPPSPEEMYRVTYAPAA
jgi:hypothetical protein